MGQLSIPSPKLSIASVYLANLGIGLCPTVDDFGLI